MSTPDKISMTTPDIVDQNVEKIGELFPNCLTQIDESGKSKKVIDFDKLQQELSSVIVDGPTERYSFNWPGKKKAMLIANAPTTKTLRPDRKKSINFDTTKNLYIEGDNLEVLKCLREAYLGKVKMIYIDPPYNTGKDFIYSDRFSESIDSYLLRSDLIDDDGNKLVANPESNGRFHTNWLNMIYPRLKVARDFLSDDGVILINIDEHEVVNLHKLVEEIYGDDNLLGTIVWDKRNPKGDSKGIASQHEYIIVCAKNRNFLLTHHVIQRKKKNVDVILKKLFGENVKMRVRPAYFPFTEPSIEIDATCQMCQGKGCSLCKGTGFSEVFGAGVVNPKVLEMSGIDSKKYSGFAFGPGIDRSVMVTNKIPNIKYLFRNDMRFLKQMR